MVSSTFAAFVVQSATTATTNRVKSSILPNAGIWNAPSTPFRSHQPLQAARLVHCTAEAVGFFSGIRLSSALIAGSSLSTIFSLVHVVKNDKGCSRLKFFLLQVYHLSAILAFILSITSVVTATSAGTTLLLGRHSPLAENVYIFMKRELHFEFVITRWAFLTSVLLFLTAVGERIVLEFDMIDGDKKRYGPFVVLIWTSLVSFLLSYTNSVLQSWPNLFMMTGEVLKLVLDRAKLKNRPLGTLAIVSFIGAIVSGVREIIRGSLDDNDVAP